MSVVDNGARPTTEPAREPPSDDGNRNRRYWCEWAWTGDPVTAVAPGVLFEVDTAGRIVAVTVDTAVPADAERLPGLTVAGLANTHSHAFHRALRGRTHTKSGSFWSWREQMYRVAGRLTPDTYFRLARAVYAEMALGGITTVGEFHYVHHAPGGTPYDDPNAMGAALVAAAAEVGIRITVLDTCFLAGGIASDGSHRHTEPRQARFSDGDADAWVRRVDAFQPRAAHARRGAAVHSVRTVPAEQIPVVAGWADDTRAPLHAHVSEQPAENEAAMAAYGRTPTAVLARARALGERSTLVHATHLSDDDVRTIRASASGVCLCPTTERDLADGIPRTGDLVTAACSAEQSPVRVSIGTDQHAQIDMFDEMRGVELHERLRTGRRGTLNAPHLYRAGTRNGHVALGWGTAAAPEAGVLLPGARADLVNIGLDSVRLAGFDPAHAPGAAVFAATAADVRHVMADGRWIVRDRIPLALPDVTLELDSAIRRVVS